MSHFIVLGLGFGDETKGSTVDWLCATNNIAAVVRFNGGPQAAHNVITPDGRHHTFAQFGSGTFHGVPTVLSRHMLVNPFNLLNEAEHLTELGVEDPLSKVFIERGALLITPYHRHANRLRETARGASRHGSTGQGVGEARGYAIASPSAAPIMGDLFYENRLKTKLTILLSKYMDEFGPSFGDDLEAPSKLASTYTSTLDFLNIISSTQVDALFDTGDCVFEGAQGVLLDELYGFNPHTTWTNTTQANARDLLAGRPAAVYGLTRTYHTRHGAGPFPTELDPLRWPAGELEERFLEPHNGTGKYQGAWRIGGLDLSLLRYAVYVNGGIDHLVVSHMDYIGDDNPIAWSDGYESTLYTKTPPPQPWLASGEILGAPFNLAQSTQLGLEIGCVRPGNVYGKILSEDDVDEVMLRATGIKPTVYSYGPTWKDKKLANVPAVL